MLEHLLLGLLDEPVTGYDLGRRFEQTVGIFWSAELSQIYPTLHRLEEKGLATSSHAPPRAGPARRLYRRTPKGERALESWLRSDPEPARPRIPYLAQVFFMGQLDDDAPLEDLLRHLRSRFLEQRKHLLAIAAANDGDEEAGRKPATRAELSARLVLDAGLVASEARIAWVDTSLARIAAHREDPV